MLLDGYRDGSAPIRFRSGRRPVTSVFWNPPFMRDTPKHGHFIFYAHLAEETWRAAD